MKNLIEFIIKYNQRTILLMTTELNITQIDKITSKNYGFRCFDYDEDRGEAPDAGRYLVGKEQVADMYDLSPQQQALQCYNIFTKYLYVTIENKGTFKAKSLHISGCDIIVLGLKA